MHEKMKMEQLEYFGIPDYIIRIWKEYYSDFLLPIQEKAVREFNLLQSGNHLLYSNSELYLNRLKNMLVISPSSSGKTLLGEMAALGEIYGQKKVIFLVPLRILAEEKYLHFVKLYHSTGLNVKFSSRDHRNHDRDIIQGNFNIAIIVYEKFYYFLQQYPLFFNNVSLVIADEIQLIADIQRGPRLESNFKYLKNNYPAVKIIGLSAFTEHLLPIAAWLDASLIYSSFRPVELRKGIVRKGVYKYIEHNSKRTGEEIFFPKDEVEECNLASYLHATLRFLINQNESNLIFLPTKNEVRMWSRWMATQFNLNPSKKAISKLQCLENSTSKEELIYLLQNGIGYHCADLSRQERHAVEGAIRAGELKIVFATDTLSAGVNLPVSNVILTGQKVVYQNNGNFYGNFCRRNLTFSEVDNMGGRAGRLRVGKPFGRIIFLAPSPVEFTTYQKLYFIKNRDLSLAQPLNDYSVISEENKLFRSYSKNNQIMNNIINDSTSSTSSSRCTNFYHHNHFETAGISSDIPVPSSASAEIINSHPIINQKDILTFLLYKIALEDCSFEELSKVFNKGEQKGNEYFWSYRFSQKFNETELISSLKYLAEIGLITLSSNYKIEITDSGRMIISKGITLSIYNHFVKWLKESEKNCISHLEILFLIASCEDSSTSFGNFTNNNLPTTGNYSFKNSKWKKYLYLRLLNLIFQEQEEEKPIFRDKLHITQFQSNQKNYKIDSGSYYAIKNTLIMHDWIENRELVEIEEDYGILGGSIQRMGEEFSWLVDTLSIIAEKEGWKEDRADDLIKIKLLSMQLIYGVGSEGISLARLNIPNLTRYYINKLAREGYNSEQCLRELSDNQLKQFLPDLLVQEIKDYFARKNSYPNSENGLTVSNHHNSDNGNNHLINTFTHINDNQSTDIAPTKKSGDDHIKSENCMMDDLIEIDQNRPDRIIFSGENIAISKTGFQLISLLARNKGKLLSYEEILDILWPSDEDATYHRLWYHLGKLRNGMKDIIISRHKGDITPAEAGNYLKEKVLKVFPGRGLLLNSQLHIKWI